MTRCVFNPFIVKHCKRQAPVSSPSDIISLSRHVRILSQYVSALRPPKRPRQTPKPSDRDEDRCSTSSRKRVRSLTYERRPLHTYSRTSPSVEEELRERRRWAGLSASCDRLHFFSSDSDPDSVEAPETDAEEWKQVRRKAYMYNVMY